jgi:hypothetical protein
MNIFRIHIAMKWAVPGFQPIQYLPDLLQGLVIETCSGLTHMDEPSLLVIQAEYQRAKILTGAFRIRVSPDNTIDGLSDFDLQPLAAASLLVSTGARFCKNAFQSLLLRGFKQIQAVVEMVGIAKRFAG